MEDKFEIILNKQVYKPGENVDGIVRYTVSSEDKVKAIRIKFKGRAKIYWKEGRYTSYSGQETYFETESDLLSEETELVPGVYDYPFQYALPSQLPSTMEEIHGTVRYYTQATLDKPWTMDNVIREAFTVNSYNDLSTMPELKLPVEIMEEKVPLSIFGGSSAIKVQINLPQTGYKLKDTICFSARVKNESNVDVNEIRFKFVQGFQFYAENKSTQHDSFTDEELIVNDGNVPAGTEKKWNLELKISPDTYAASLENCEIIKVFWELRGEICLPFPHTNFTIHCPFVLGVSS